MRRAVKAYCLCLNVRPSIQFVWEIDGPWKGLPLSVMAYDR